MRLKTFFKILSITIGLFAVTLLCFWAFWLSPRYVVPIMMYHQVEPIDHHEANWVTPEIFEQHMSFLYKHKYNVITLNELVTLIQKGDKLARNTVVITFDDGYKNNYTYAFPVLKKYEFPATIFMPAEKVGQADRLNYKQIQEMLAHEIDLGSHTLTEAYLPDLPPEQQKDEIVKSKIVLSELFDHDIEILAYPIGGFNGRIKKMVQQAGYIAACTTNRGSDRLNRDVYELNRIRFSGRDDSFFVLWSKLSGYYNLFRKMKSPQ